MQKQYTHAELDVLAQAYYDNHYNLVHHAHIDIAGDLVAGTLLSRILFWFKPTQDGKLKVRVFKDGHYWLAKNREDWWDEIRITPKQYDRAVKILEQKNLIVKKLYKFDGNPTTHLRPNYEVIHEEIEKWKNDIKEKIVRGEIDEKGRKTNSPKGKKPDVSTPQLDFPWDNQPIGNDQPQENQGESPNPLENLEFPQRGKTDSTDGEEQIRLMGNDGFDQTGRSLTGNTNSEYTQGSYTGITEYTGKTNHSVVGVVVGKKIEEYKRAICEFFVVEYDLLDEYELSDQEIAELAELANQHGKDLIDCIYDTYQYAVNNDVELESLYGAFKHAIEKGWRKTIKARPKVAKRSSAEQPQEYHGLRLDQKKVKGFKPYNWVNK